MILKTKAWALGALTATGVSNASSFQQTEQGNRCVWHMHRRTVYTHTYVHIITDTYIHTLDITSSFRSLQFQSIPRVFLAFPHSMFVRPLSLKILVLSNHLNASVHLPRPVIHAPKGLGFALRVSLLNLSLEFICHLNSSNGSYLMSK